MIRLSFYVKEEFCIMDLKSQDKHQAIKELAEVLKKSKELTDVKLFLSDVFKREEMTSTGIGDGVAIPHGRTDAIKEFVIAFGRSKEGVEFDSIDGKKVNLIFLMGASNQDLNLYLRLLGELSKFVINPKFREELMSAKTGKEVVDIFYKYEGFRSAR